MKPTWQIHYVNKVISTTTKHFKEFIEKDYKKLKKIYKIKVYNNSNTNIEILQKWKNLACKNNYIYHYIIIWKGKICAHCI